MKICVVSTPIFRLCPPQGTENYAGLEVIAYHVARGLAAKGHEVSIVCPDGSEVPGVTAIPIGPERRVDEKTAHSKVWEHLLKQECIVDHSWNKWSMILKMEGRLKVPCLNVMHAPIHTMIQALPPVEKPCFVCISEDQKNHFGALFAPAVARVAKNGCDTEFYSPLNVPRSKRFLFLARFSSVKCPHLAQEACLEAGVGLDMVGDTQITGEPEYLQKCLSRADGKQIRLYGGVGRGACVNWYSQAYCLLHLVRDFREPFGLGPVEAQLCGCPVISWNSGAMRETIDPGKSGFLVRSVREAVDLIRSNAVASIDRNYCRQWAMQFSLSNMIDKYDSLCLEAAEGGGW